MNVSKQNIKIMDKIVRPKCVLLKINSMSYNDEGGKVFLENMRVNLIMKPLKLQYCMTTVITLQTY